MFSELLVSHFVSFVVHESQQKIRVEDKYNCPELRENSTEDLAEGFKLEVAEVAKTTDCQ
jgi:hypothetical protein